MQDRENTVVTKPRRVPWNKGKLIGVSRRDNTRGSFPSGSSSIGVNPHLFGTHSLRRTKATLIYRRTDNLRACSSCSGTQRLKAPAGTLASRSIMPWPTSP
jgi:hypothetical protein